MKKQNRKRRFRLNWSRLKTACANAWFAFVLAGTGAIAFSDKAIGPQVYIVGSIAIVFGIIMLVTAVIDTTDGESQ